MANPFYVQPASPLAGFQALGEGIGSRVEFERSKAEEARKQGVRQEAGQLMQTGTPEEIAQFALENPWIREDVDAALGFVNEQTKQNAIDTARRIVLGGEGATEEQKLDYADVKGRVFSTNVFADDKNRYLENENYIYDTKGKFLYRKDNWGFSGSGGNMAVGPEMVAPGEEATGVIEPLQEFVTLAGDAPVGPEGVDWKSEYQKGLESFRVTPSEALIDRAEFVIGQGGDATGTMQLAEQAQQDPQIAIDEALKTLAIYGETEAVEQYRALTQPAFVGKPTDIQKQYTQAKTEGFPGSLLDYQLTLSGKDKTNAIKEFEYSEKNPAFAIKQEQKRDAAATKAASEKTFGDASTLRKEFLAQSKDYQKVRDSYTRVVGSTQDPSPAGDLSLIFNYMKMLDPGSVVRESEFSTAASAGSYGERIQAEVQKVLSGQRLTENMRADFLSKSASLLEGMELQHEQREDSYRGIARRNALPEQDVVTPLGAPEPEQAPVFTEGQAATGPGGQKMIFRGGNWEVMNVQ